MKLKIEYVDINSIKPYEKNAKLHPEEQIEQIKESIEQFGMDDPIGIWKDEIVEGHGRLIACKELGYTEVPIIRLDHLSDEERKAYTLVHNKLTMNTDFDINSLSAELFSIEDIDMGDYGFDLGIEDDDYGTDFELPDGDKLGIDKMTLYFANEQTKVIEKAIEKINLEEVETFGNEHKKGNAIYEVVRQWLMLKK
jgi:hypothetical protein